MEHMFVDTFIDANDPTDTDIRFEVNGVPVTESNYALYADCVVSAWRLVIRNRRAIIELETY